MPPKNPPVFTPFVLWQGPDEKVLQDFLAQGFPASFHHIYIPNEDEPQGVAFFLRSQDAATLIEQKTVTIGSATYSFKKAQKQRVDSYAYQLERSLHISSALPICVTYQIPDMPRKSFDVVIKNTGEQTLHLSGLQRFPRNTPAPEWSLKKPKSAQLQSGYSNVSD